MRIPVSWLAEHLELPEETTAETLAEAFIRIGLEVEEVTHLTQVRGPLVVGRVAEIEELTEFKKPIRYCQVEVGKNEADEQQVQGIICGARNFQEGDLVVVALPGTVLPGDFEITSRKTYGKLSEGMICSTTELGIGDDADGILVLPPGSADPGDDAVGLVGLDDSIIELAITPDRGYCFSVRGLARELSNALEVPFGDPGTRPVPEDDRPSRGVELSDPTACSRFVLRRVTGVDPTAPSPWWIRRRLALAGMRSISLAVDVTNYVMLELGQPLHAFDATKVTGDLVVRRAEAGEKLITLDGVSRELDPDDIVIADETGPVSLAGVMGGESTEIGHDTHDVLLEAANWDPASIARAIRRHKLPSEAGKRFERQVDPAVAPVAVELAAQLLVRYGDGTIAPGRTDVGEPKQPAPVTMPLALPDKIAGVSYERGVTARRLGQIGCRIEVSTSDEGVGLVTATPPTWRPDLTQPYDLVEEVLRLEGYHTIPSVLPAAPPGRGLTGEQRRERAVSRALAAEGYVEVLPFPFVGKAMLDAFGLAEDDERRRTASVLNALESDRSLLTTTLLTGLAEVMQRNVSRGQRDLALFHIGQVVQPAAEQPPVPEVGVAQRPSDEQLAALEAALPAQPKHVAVLLGGHREQAGWWGKGREASWADAVQAARVVAAAAGVELEVGAGELAPWHPGRCAQLKVGGTVVGHAGELHPKVVEALGLPKRTCAMELDLDALPLVDNRPAPQISPYPPVLMDIALVVDAEVAAADLVEAVRAGGGELLEDVRLFDVYAGEQLGEGKKSLALALRFRAPDRTLKQEEATEARDAAVKSAADRLGATLRA
ncbi:phenylalanyl-tRNA synthetase beta subunit [Saccharopolyspora kobensis]|uniref:Phenylalanine--tRNA ligase beta subunit n=2 Tax=Saccharopolyspora kobensis TaxID=146035 RepID=A0A1H6ELA0_9PSEU|nr:phenylalanine--tRNA ligase subunit beta [Saccharopolyspora kobensis]SEG97816.1 phenylalanyl-tRNA synthetase beta subunit [Saccharopolyspora kobensis]SFF24680.1 phenylalanyl-tRNA synthetase beta subunit [Saccharopolyspora kobensis]